MMSGSFSKGIGAMVLRGEFFRKAVAVGETFLSKPLSPLCSPSTFRVTVAFREPAKLIAVYSDGVAAEEVYLNSGGDLVAKGVYAFDLPVTAGCVVNFMLSVATVVIIFSVTELEA